MRQLAVRFPRVPLHFLVMNDTTADTRGEGALRAEGQGFGRGNPLRWVRGGLTAGLGGLFAFLVMAHDQKLRMGVPVGAFFVAVAAFGLTDLLGTFDDGADRLASTTALGQLAVPLAQALLALAAFLLSLAGAASGWWSGAPWGCLVTLAFVGSVIAVFRLGVRLGPWKKDEDGHERPLWKRHGFWLLLVASLLFLPFLGSYSLSDPWEAQYGEVAREILARDDWISLWWAQENWFWSKPIMDFWIQAMAMATLGVHYQPDRMLVGVGGAAAHPEWVVRAPVFLLTVLATYLLYKGVARAFGRRAGLLGGVVLLTMPYWYFIAHQTMTDMPFVAPMTGAMGLLLLGLFTDADTKVQVYEVVAGRARWRVSGWHLVFGTILLTALPQILYLLSRNVELVLHGQGPLGFRLHWDDFRSGSGLGNCGLPGNEACVIHAAASVPPSVRGVVAGAGPTLWRWVGAFEPSLQALVWAAVVAALLYMSWGERRTRRLYYLGAWFFAALATMAKGPAGFGLPMLAGFGYVCVTKRWKELLAFELVSGLLIILAVAIPWYVAMYVRHGSPFTDRLIFSDMINRAFGHVHDTNEGEDTGFRFYIWQLGYGLFPWTGLVPLGLVSWLGLRDGRDKAKNHTSILLVMWFLFAFALFTFMGTKFHHYILPAVPPLAMLVGVVLDGMLGAPPRAEMQPDARHARLMTSGAVVAGALMLAVVGRDLAIRPDHGAAPGAIRLLQLFTYNYRRVWPDSLDFSRAITCFAVLAVMLGLALSIRAIQKYVVIACLALSLAWAGWGLDVYMLKIAPHWGQREVILAYYTNRVGPEEPLVAYHMNWKGENFYTGNHVSTFVSSGAPFATWLKAQREKGVRAVYFVTEHGSVGGLKGEVVPKDLREVTTKEQNNKFVLVRAEL
jgi:4-amino-4-deoxy-L-arabinose transferase-like glycosyltransferase